MRGSDVNSEGGSELWATARRLSEMLPGEKTERAWLDHAKREDWASRKAEGGGRGRGATEFLIPPEIQTLITARQRVHDATAGKIPLHMREAVEARLAAVAAPSAAARAHAPVPAEPQGHMKVMSRNTEMVARCIVAAERALPPDAQRLQAVTLGLDTWGALCRMFHEDKADHLAAIADVDLDLLARFILNTKAVITPGIAPT